VLACVDFSPATDQVAREACVLAARSGAPIHLLHVAAPEPDLVGYENRRVRDRRAGELRGEHRELEELAARLRVDGVPTTPMLVEGSTVETILAEAERLGADLVVVGSHGYGSVHRFLVGSTVDQLVRRSDRPVVVVPVGDDS
jgi:nucleotide-binding universal stress UspA family protein